MADPHRSNVVLSTPICRKDTASSLLAKFSPIRAATSPAQKSPPRPEHFAKPTSSSLPTDDDSQDPAATGDGLDTPVTPLWSSIGHYGTAQARPEPRTPASQIGSDGWLSSSPSGLLQSPPNSDAVITSHIDCRSAGERSLRARQSLPLSAKAKANLVRGIKDPREIQALIPKAAKSPKSPSPQSKLEQTAQNVIWQRHDAFILENRSIFSPVLPPTLNYVQRLDELRESSQANLEASDFSKVKKYTRIKQQPNGIVATMKEHQLEGLSFLVWLQDNGINGILGDEMGLGKTLQVLSLLQYMKEHPAAHEIYKPNIVVCPLSVLHTWQLQAREFAPGLATMIVHAPVTFRKSLRARLRKAVNEGSVDIVILSYETYEREQLALRRYKWSCAILDEGHKMKNANSQTAKALQTIGADHRLILTGTPIQNDLFELWSLFHWILPRVFDVSTRSLFEDSFILSKRDGVNMATIASARNLLELVMLRRTKEDVQADMKLPALEQVVLSIPLTPLQREIYMTCMTSTSEDTLERIAQQETMPASDVEEDSLPSAQDKSRHFRELLNLLMQLRKVSIHPYLLPGIQPDPYELGPHLWEASGKFLVLKTLLLKLIVDEGKKVIVFSGFKGALDCTEDLLNTIIDPGLKFLRIDGDGNRAFRNLSVRLFQEDKQYSVMLATLRAGGFGLTLTAAQAVVILDEDWNPQVTVQAAARAHRIGQTKPVTLYKLVSSGTVEVQMGRRIAKKLYLSAKVTDDFKHTNAETWNDKDDDDEASAEADGGSSMHKFSFSQLASIIRRGGDTISAGSVPVSDMLEWDFEKIMSQCRETRSEAEIDEEDEEKWLQERERTQTRMFEGVVHERAKKSKNEESEGAIFDSPRAARRLGKETTVIVDGFTVSKSSMACQTGEAVPTFAGKDASLRDKVRKTRPEFGHIETCAFCDKTTDEELVNCYDCPKTYHQSCVDGSKILTSIARHMRQCPAHKCCKCMQTASNCGGLLYKCTKCPRAYCEDDVDYDLCRLIGFELKAFTDMGYFNSQKEFYIECKLCVDKSTGRKNAEMNKNSESEHMIKEEEHSVGPPATPSGKRKEASKTAGSARAKRVRTGTAASPIVIDSD